MEVNTDIICGDWANDLHELPKEGFFVIQCKSKNNIFVDGNKVNYGRQALLHHKSTISIGNSVKLYFLLPEKEQQDTGKKKTKKRAVDEELKKSNASKRPRLVNDNDTTQKSTPTKNVEDSNIVLPTTNSANTEMIKSKPPPSSAPPASQTSIPTTTQTTTTTTTITTATTAPAKKNQEKGEKIEQLEKLPTPTLMTRFYSAISSNQWERRHQTIGSALSVHAVRDAARSKSLQKLASTENGKVSRGDVMDWIENSTRYREWVKLMLAKMELKSYQGNIGKALVRAGYERYGTTGRQVKWGLPKNLMNEPYSDDDDDDNEEEEEEERKDNNNVEKKDENNEQVNNNNNGNNNENADNKEIVKEENDNNDINQQTQQQQKILNQSQYEVIAID